MARTPPETARFDDENGAGLSDRRGLTSSPSPPMFAARRPCPSRPGVSAAVAHVDPLCLSTTGTTAGDPGRLPRIVSVVPPDRLGRSSSSMLDSVVDDSLARVCRRAMRQSTSSEAYRAGSGPRRRARFIQTLPPKNRIRNEKSPILTAEPPPPHQVLRDFLLPPPPLRPGGRPPGPVPPQQRLDPLH